MIRASCLLFIIGVVLGCAKCGAPQNSLTDSTAEARVVRSQFVNTALKVLEENHRLGSLVYRGHCTDSGGVTDSFEISPIPQGMLPVEALRRAFDDDPTFSVKEDTSGMIRVVGGGVQPDILGLTIHDVIFQEESDPREATYKLLASPELKSYMQSHGMEFVTTSGGLIPPPSGRHLTARLNNITISQSLDRIAQTFPGVWIYEECLTGQGEKRVEVRFHEFSAMASSDPGAK